MKTEWFMITNSEMEEEALEKGAELIRSGNLVAFPTETVYGLGASAFDGEACAEIFAVKGRPQDNPLIVHVDGLEMADKVIGLWNDKAKLCAEQFWPGPLTLVMPKSSLIPHQVSAGLDTVAVRMPAHSVALALIEKAGVPIAAPSANVSGKPSPTRGDHVWEDFEGKIPLIIDGGACEVGLESTVLDVSEEIPVILRPGGITKEQLEEVIGYVEVESRAESKPRSPGTKYRHYAPQGMMILFCGEKDKVKEKMGEKIKEGQQRGQRVGVLCAAERERELAEFSPDLVFPLGSEQRPEEFAASLYEALRQCDLAGIELILAEGIEEDGLGAAVMNRMLKAAGNIVRF